MPYRGGGGGGGGGSYYCLVNGSGEILLKFLRAREFNANEAFEMLRNALQWRKENNINLTLILTQ
jgi:hypothetical protein